MPTEVIKTRMQTASYGHLAKSSFAAAKLVLSSDGISGFYRGFGTTIMREVRSQFIFQHFEPAARVFLDSIHLDTIPSV